MGSDRVEVYLPKTGRPEATGPAWTRTEHVGGAGWTGGRPGGRMGAVFDAFPSPDYFKDVLGKRTVAFLIDHAIGLALWGAVLLATLVFGVFAFLVTLGLVWFVLPFPFLLFMVGYYALTLGSPRRASLGMRLMGLELRTQDGGSPGLLRSALFSALYYVSVLPTGGLALAAALILPRGRTLHELFSGTVVVNRLDGPEVIPPR